MAKSKVPQNIAVIDKDLELPEHIEDVRVMKLRLDRQAIETSRKATDELLVSRKLYDKQDADSISASDPVSLVYMAVDDTLTGHELAYKAAMYYQGQIAEVRREAMVIAMTMHTDLGARQPKPYPKPGEGEDTSLPAWLRDEVNVPEPERNLKNRYEYRLKLIYDLLDEAGALFSARFQQILDDDLAVQLRKLMEAESTDEAGFQSTRTRRKVSEDTVPAN
jgi:hypothetical protein